MGLVTIDVDKLCALLEYKFSLHEADELSYMLTDKNATSEDIVNYLKQIEQNNNE